LGTGACPDEVIFGGREDLVKVSGSYLNGYLKAVFKRNIITGDPNADQDIIPDEYATIVAAIGPINANRQAGYHSIKFTKSTDPPIKIAFSKPLIEQNCTALNVDAIQSSSIFSEIKAHAWRQEKIRGESIFRVHMGPSGGDRGYTGITGRPNWGLAYWINGLLIPELHVERGKNYTFIVETGNDPSNQIQYYPFYVTNSPEGGGGQNENELNTPTHMIYAGVTFRRGSPDPSPGAGRYCEWKHRSGSDSASEVNSIEEYKETLRLECRPGSPAVFTWSPDYQTPDVVYYQVNKI